MMLSDSAPAGGHGLCVCSGAVGKGVSVRFSASNACVFCLYVEKETPSSAPFCVPTMTAVTVGFIAVKCKFLIINSFAGCTKFSQ